MQPMLPFSFNSSPEIDGAHGFWVHVHEFNYMDSYIIDSIMVFLIEVMTYSVNDFFGGYVVKMHLESLHDTVFGLAYVLFLALFASNTVNQIVALAVNPGSTGVGSFAIRA